MAKNKVNNGLFDVSDLAANAQKNIEERNAHSAQHTQDAQHTQGAHDAQNAQRKQKHPRINMAFYGDNLDYAREAAYRRRMSVTEYVNQLIIDDKNRGASGFGKPVDPEQLSIDDI